jgi:Mg/Co/Ni transporter MgtE
VKNDRWASALVRRLVKNADPEGMVDIVELFLPTIVNSFSTTQRKAFIRLLLERDLGLLLQGLSPEERAHLLEDLIPVLAREFPLYKVDLVSAVDLARTHADSPERESNE